MIPVCLPAHTSHLLQPLDVGLFGPVQHAYGRKVTQLSQLGVTHISKLEFLSILTDACVRAYTPENIAGAWRGAGIELYNPSTVLQRIPGASPETPPSASPTSALLQTPRSAVQVDNILGSLLGTERSPRLVRGLTMLAKGAKTTLSALALLQEREKDLLGVNARRPTRKRRLTTTRGEFLTPARAAKLRRVADKQKKKELDTGRLRQLQAERLSALQAGGLLKGRKRLPKGHLVVLPVAYKEGGEAERSTSSSESSEEVEEGVSEVLGQ